MLVITRQKNESIVLGDNITLTVIEIRGDKVRLGIVCPRNMSVHRQEVFDAIHGRGGPAPLPPRPPEEAAFLRDILASPDDVGIRLIFADWLQERDDPRGEFIRTQCLLAELPVGDERRFELRKRERQLWNEHGQTWRAYLPEVLRSSAFQRGFVEAVELSVAGFVGRAAEIFLSSPVRRLKVLPPWSHGLAGALASSPHLARLSELDLGGLGLGDGEAADLAASPQAASLTTLLLQTNAIGDEGARALASSPYLSGWLRLDLSGNPIGAEGAAALRARFGGRVRLDD
jgi:carbon storage regulator CsrA